MTVPNPLQHFHRLQQKLVAEYDLTAVEFDPCNVRTTGDLKGFITEIVEALCEGELEFLESKNPHEAAFVYEGEALSLCIDERFGHIEIDFQPMLETMAMLVGQLICKSYTAQAFIIGDEEDMRTAWAEGLPIPLPEIDYRYRHLTGKRFQREETGAVFILPTLIDPVMFERIMLSGMNAFLQRRNYELRYQTNQLVTHRDTQGYVSIYGNGDYWTRFRVVDNKTEVSGSFEGEVFLGQYLAGHPELVVRYRTRTGETRAVGSFGAFIATLGKVA